MFGGFFRSSSAPPPAASVSKPVSAMEESSSSLPSSTRPAQFQPLRRYRRQNRQCQQRSLAPSSQLSAVSSNDSTIDRRNLSRSTTVLKNRDAVFMDSHTANDGNNSEVNSIDQPRNPAIWNKRYMHRQKQSSSKSLPSPQKQQLQPQQRGKAKQQRRRLRASSILSLPSSLPGQGHNSSASFSCSSSSPIMSVNDAKTTTKQPSVFFLAGHPSSKLKREESYRHGLEILTQMGQTTNDVMRRHRGEMMQRDLEILSRRPTESIATTTTTSIIGDDNDENKNYDEYFISLTDGSASPGGTVLSTTSSLKRDSSLSL